MRSHWPFAIVASLGLALLLINLGSGYLWADEGDTAVLASNILKFGVPKAWDGVTFMDSDFGARENDQLVMVSSPWVQYYLAAASFALFGQNTFAARLPFALAGWMSILFVYFFVWRITVNRWAGFCAAALLVSSVQFLLYCRQCRYYSLSILLTCGLIWIFFQMKSARHCVLFAITAILLFHAHPIGIMPVAVLGILTLIYRPFSFQRRWFWFAFPAIIAFTLPWFALAHAGYTENTAPLRSSGEFFVRLIQYLLECASVTPLIGIAILFSILLVFRKFAPSSPPPEPRGIVENGTIHASGFVKSQETAFLVVIFATFLSYALAMALTQRTAALWVTGVRYTAAIIPLLAMAAGLLIVKISWGKISIWLPLLLVFAFTNLAQITPWLFWADTNPDPENKLVAAHVPEKVVDRFFATGELLFLRDLWRSNPGTLAKSCEFLRQHAQPGDVVITNYESEPLYFHTRLPQGMKITRQDPIYEAARRRGLPEYIFGVDRARWVIWRFNWDDYLGINWAEVERHFLSEGAQITEMAKVEETAWENRENIHFHRFSGDTYLFPSEKDKPSARVFRIDWPA
ncbi:MAG TPA: glycosyltransferase family 39 protein, partial [Chthoniobacterales bacterium]|nr:glycosyltransferase family 39 protein [Chthoniobacterales bacterium]